MLLRYYVVEKCLMNVSSGCVQNIVYLSPTGPWVRVSLTDCIIVYSPKCLIG